MRLLPFTLSLLTSYSSFALQDSVITRGPYLQAGTEQFMIIRWRTSVVSQCTVKYGKSFNQQGSDVVESTATNEHEVTIGGLQSGTKYYCS